MHMPYHSITGEYLDCCNTGEQWGSGQAASAAGSVEREAWSVKREALREQGAGAGEGNCG
jgi:hypothetical protein